MTPEEVASRRQLAEFLEDLHRRVRESPEAVPNSDLADFLSGAAGWVEDVDGYFRNRGEPTPEGTRRGRLLHPSSLERCFTNKRFHGRVMTCSESSSPHEKPVTR